jgi:hypothetical protein
MKALAYTITSLTPALLGDPRAKRPVAHAAGQHS